MTAELLTTADGRALDVLRYGSSGPLVVWLHGTPEGHAPLGSLRDAVLAAGGQLVTFARPGYARSTRLPGRDAAAVVADVAAVADWVGAGRFVVGGDSGGGPHSLACAALLPDRVAAAATVAGVAPWGADGLDWLAGMGEGNEVEFGAALQGEQALRPLLEEWRGDVLAGGVAGTTEMLSSVLGAADSKVFTGAVAEHFHRGIEQALLHGVDGWLDDDLVFASPWGFDLAVISVPVCVWQGDDDLMVPPAHGRWLVSALPTAEDRLLPGEGHLTILMTRADEVVGQLLAHL